MALEYVLHIEADEDLGPEAALHALLDEVGVEGSPRATSDGDEDDEDDGDDEEIDRQTIEAAGVVMRVVKSSPVEQEIIEEAFGFRPTLRVWFRIAPKERRAEGRQATMRAALRLLDGSHQDAVLLFNGEDVVLQRIGEQLVLNEQFAGWGRPVLDDAAVDYEVRDIPSPLL